MQNMRAQFHHSTTYFAISIAGPSLVPAHMLCASYNSLRQYRQQPQRKHNRPLGFFAHHLLSFYPTANTHRKSLTGLKSMYVPNSLVPAHMLCARYNSLRQNWQQHQHQHDRRLKPFLSYSFL